MPYPGITQYIKHRNFILKFVLLQFYNDITGTRLTGITCSDFEKFGQRPHIRYKIQQIIKFGRPIPRIRKLDIAIFADKFKLNFEPNAYLNKKSRKYFYELKLVKLE